MFTDLDWLVLSAYFGLTFAVAYFASRGEKTTGDANNYFLAGRDAGWFVIGVSLFASNIGSEHLVGLAGEGSKTGLVVGQIEILAAFMLMLLGWLFAPFYLRSGVYTMPEFLERRYGSAARSYLAIVSVIAYVLTKIAVTIFAGAIVFETLLGIEFWTGAIIVVLSTGAYTVFGGLRAVLYTDLVQGILLILGSIAVTALGLQKLGGVGELQSSVSPTMLSMWRSMSDPDFPWTGILFGAPILGVWYWCTDQFIVQRVLSAKNISEARRGTIFAGFLKLLPLFIFVVPGLIAFALKARGELAYDTPNNAYAALVGAVLPTGIRGLVAAALLAALMSSLSSVFNSCSTLVTLDLYRKFRPQASQRRLVFVGQMATAGLVLLGLAWIPFVDQAEGTIYKYIQNIQGYISPPIAAVFLFGILWKGANGKGAMASLWTGFALGMGRLSVETAGPAWSTEGFIGALITMNFLHFAILLFAICSLVLVVVSIQTAPPTEAQVKGLVMSESKGAREPRSMTDILLSAGLVLAVFALWIIFR